MVDKQNLAIFMIGLVVLGGVVYTQFFMEDGGEGIDVEYRDVIWSAAENQPVSASIIVTNNEPYPKDVMVEYGIIPNNLDWFSAFNTAGWSSDVQECCPGQDNIENRFIELEPNEQREISIRTVAPFPEIEDKCGDANYWDGYGNNYQQYVLIANKCHFRDGEEQSGYEMYDYEVEGFTVFER
ncbi:MAG: hypothetical protein ACOCQD_01845 [archaeon]